MSRLMRGLALAGVALLTLVVFAACQAGGLLGPTYDAGDSEPGFARNAAPDANATKSKGTLRISVLLNAEITDSVRAELSRFGKIADEIAGINAVVLQGKADVLEELRALPFVIAANPDAERNIPPGVDLPMEDFADGLSTWNLDVVNVTDFGFDNRQVAEDGTGVFVAVLDTGLLKNWPHYFPVERIAVDYAKSFTGSDNAAKIAEQPNKWEHDTNAHGTHVTSTIIGYNLSGTPVNGVAPLATIIPVKVLNNNGSGWSSMVAAGITYIGDLKAGPLANVPVVINMSLGGPVLDAVEQAAIDYAISQGVIIVASAGNNGEAGMGYPGAYEPVISVAASGWVGEWYPPAGGAWWYALDVPEDSGTSAYYITDFSSRELPGQDLDVAAPGSWIVGPYQLNQGQLSYYFLGGTSMASPHVAGIAALMAQKDGSLTGPQVESILEEEALPIAPGSVEVMTPSGPTVVTWGADATGSGLATADGALAAVAAP